MGNKVCKKCQKPLPEGYKYKKCESCLNAQAQGVKNGIKTVCGVVSGVVSGVAIVAAKGKYNSKE